MKMPKVSVIIPAYNEEKCIERGVKSALNGTRTYPGEYEIIVVDNVSSDGTYFIVQELTKKHPQVKLEQQHIKGVSHARNKGASVATGEYLVFLDADSQVGPKFLERTITEMEAKSLEAASCCARPNIPTVSNKFLLWVFNVFMLMLQHTSRPIALGAAIIAKKEVHMMIGGFDIDMYYGEDSRYVTKAKDHAKFALVKEPFIFDMRRVYSEGKIRSVAKLLWAFGHHLLFRSTKKIKFRYDHDYK